MYEASYIHTLKQIDELAKLEGSEINKAKEVLAYELTELVHGKEEATKAQDAARAIFRRCKTTTDNMPETVLTDDDFADGEIGILRPHLKKCGLIPSNGDGTRLIPAGRCSLLTMKKVTDVYERLQSLILKKAML